MSSYYQAMGNSNPSAVLSAALAVVSTLAVVLVAVLALADTHAHSQHSAGSSVSSAPHKPSAAVKILQQELGQLNYYEGSIDGVMGSQTTQAIQYVQRDAGLPQTGQMTAATETALHNFLIHGNHQMAG